MGWKWKSPGAAIRSDHQNRKFMKSDCKIGSFISFKPNLRRCKLEEQNQILFENHNKKRKVALRNKKYATGRIRVDHKIDPNTYYYNIKIKIKGKV